MGLFEKSHMPYTNFHEMNLDWIIMKVKELITEWAALRVEMTDYKTAMDSAWDEYKTDLTADWTSYQSQITARQDDFERQFNELKQFVLNYFDNVEWQDMVDDLFERWKDDGTLMALIAPHLPILTPEMFGAKGDGTTDDGDALNATMASAVTNAKPVYMSKTTYYSTKKVEIPGTVSILGNGSKIEFAAGVSGIVFTDYAPNSRITNLIIKSRNALVEGSGHGVTGTEYPDSTPISANHLDVTEAAHDWQSLSFGSVGLEITGDHSIIDNVRVLHFNTGIFYNENYRPNANQTGTTINNVIVNYCNIGVRLGWKPKNNRCTDFYISNCTFNGNWVAAEIAACVGYQLTNIHTWGHYDYGFWLLDCGLSEFSNIYVEAARLYPFKVLAVSGGAFTNITYYDPHGYNENSTIFMLSGVAASAAYATKYIINGVIINGVDNVTYNLVKFGQNCVVMASNVINDRAPAKYDPFSGWKLTSDNFGQIYYNQPIRSVQGGKLIDIGNKTILGGYVNDQFSLSSSTLSHTVTIDTEGATSPQVIMIPVYAAFRWGNYNFKTGAYMITLYKTNDGNVHIGNGGPVELAGIDILAAAPTLAVDGTKVTITFALDPTVFDSEPGRTYQCVVTAHPQYARVNQYAQTGPDRIYNY